MARAHIPAITWEASFANTFELGYPLDMATSWSDQRAGSEFVVTSSGDVDAWDTGEDFFLGGAVRWIPVSTGTTPAGDAITGWDGSTGVRAFLAWARVGNLFRFVPDRTSMGTFVNSYLVQPMDGPPNLEPSDTTKRFDLVIRNINAEYTGY